MKKIYIAYRFSGADVNQLKKDLEYVNDIIKKTGNQTFIFNRDIQDWGNIEIEDHEIMKIAEKEINSSDIIFALVISTEKSEGMLLEIGMAKAKGKKIILAMQKGTQLFLSETIVDEIINFEKLEDLKTLIPKKL